MLLFFGWGYVKTAELVTMPKENFICFERPQEFRTTTLYIYIYSNYKFFLKDPVFKQRTFL